MSATFTCPSCGRQGSIKRDLPAGAKLRCPGCQTLFAPQPGQEPLSVGQSSEHWIEDSLDIPLDAISPSHDPVAHRLDLSPQTVPSNSSQRPLLLASSHEEGPSKSLLNLGMAGEPPFYKFLLSIVSVLDGFTVLAFILCIFLGVLAIFNFISDGQPIFAIFAGCGFAIGALITFGWLYLLTNLVRLAVDAARNIRRMTMFSEKNYYIMQQIYLDGLKNMPTEQSPTS